MKRHNWMILGYFAVLVCLPTMNAGAQQGDPGVASAEYLLSQAVEPQADGSHNAMLLGLRQIEDPALLPFFEGLCKSPYLSMRIHGLLGSAALSPERRIDLVELAELDDQRELVQVLSAAIDDKLIDNKAMATLLTWEGLDLPIRQAIALRLLAAGGEVDTTPFRESIEIELSDNVRPAEMLQYALAALLLAESNDESGVDGLAKLLTLRGESADAVIGQALDAALRHGFASVGPSALQIAMDERRDEALRLLAIQTALRLNTPGSPAIWQAMYREADGVALRTRLAMIALDSAEQVEAALFDTLRDGGEWIKAIGVAGRAIALQDDNLATAFEPLIATGQPLSVRWVTSYCQRSRSDQGPALLTLVIRHHAAGPRHHHGGMQQAAIGAVTALCEHYPQQANERLPALLADEQSALGKDINEDQMLELRQIVLYGIARAQNDSLAPLAKSIEPDQFKDFSTDALRLFIRARHDVSLTMEEWVRVSDIVQGVGQFDPAMRLQLGWAYLKHKGHAEQAIAKALR